MRCAVFSVFLGFLVTWSGSQEYQDHHALLRGLLDLIASTASVALVERLYLVFREGNSHVLASEVKKCCFAVAVDFAPYVG